MIMCSDEGYQAPTAEYRSSSTACTMSARQQIGITTTIPIEILLAAGCTPLDLNNVFIRDRDPEGLVRLAEHDGFPQNCCTWIKGIYGACVSQHINPILCVTTGDCSNTVMLMEVLRLKGFDVVPFAYPETPTTSRVRPHLRNLAECLGTNLRAAEEMRKELAHCRSLTDQLDDFTWKQGVVSGGENHLWLVSTSDFNSNHVEYEQQIEEFLRECQTRVPYSEDVLRLAYIGVPPIFAEDFYRYVEQQGARVVFNEVQRQFAMPRRGRSLSKQYTNYTYPYSINDRLQDILPQLQLRQVDGVIHYVQTFCHRSIGDIIFRHAIQLPVLTLEANTDYILAQQSRTKIEAFLDMLSRRRRLPNHPRRREP
jgi:benzoyl-CoA reductase/2-hydroxyglutaryl-CoA dehydratase subunit BcrC/BadD/HgdB